MKLPRWLVIAMLTSSLLAVLAAAGWWWVTWPERTAMDFVGMVADGSSTRCSQLFGLDDEASEVLVELFPEPGCCRPELDLGPRQFLDLLCCRQDFRIRVRHHERSGVLEIGALKFTACHGKVEYVATEVSKSL